MATTSFYTLFESASGYGLFSILETEEIGAFLEEVRHLNLDSIDVKCDKKMKRHR
jgi:hypothetical protein